VLGGITLGDLEKKYQLALTEFRRRIAWKID